MELMEAIKTRRSVRKFKPEPPPAELVDQVIEAGLWAASGRGKQGAVIIDIKDPDWKERISQLNARIMGKNYEKGHGPDPLFGAPVCLLVIAKTDNGTGTHDGSLVLGNMMLRAHELGLGSCWIHRAKQEIESPLGEELLQKLGIADQGPWEGVGHLALGWPDGDIPPPESKPRAPGRVFRI